MKQLLSILFILFVTSSFAQISDEILELDYSKGLLYASVKIPIVAIENSVRTQLKDIEGYYLIFLPPIYKTREDTLKLSVESFYERMDQSKDTILIEKYYEVVEGYSEPFVSQALIDRNCLSASNDSMIGIEFSEIEAQYGHFQTLIDKKAYENGAIERELSIPFQYQYIETPYRIIKTTTFNPSAYQNIDYLKIIYLKGINWSPFRQVLCTNCYPALRVSSLQKALRAQGFDVSITNTINQATKDAILAFKKENNIETEGYLDNETVKLLEIEKFENRKPSKKIYKYKDSPRH